MAEIETLKNRLEFYEESPYNIAYKASKNTVDKLCSQLEENHIDLFTVEDKPKFEMIHKFLTELSSYIDTIEKIRAKMNPEIAAEIDEKAKSDKRSEKDKSMAV